MKEAFINKKFTSGSLDLLGDITRILDKYEEQGYDLSLRQLYYQLVAEGRIENSEKSYKNVGNLVSDARLAGLIDWQMIQDRGRTLVRNNHWKSPSEIIEASAQQFRIDHWGDQPVHVEVMVEKQALEGVLIPVCQSLDVSFSANKGYSSSSALYDAGYRLASYLQRGIHVTILYLGDHDPSGMDMTRDVEERLKMFSRYTHYDNARLHVRRIALNMDQIEDLNPPENPAKLTDSRASEYIKRYGDSSWELDAIPPNQLASLVENAVLGLRDDDIYEATLQKEERMRNDILRFLKEYNKKKSK